MIKRLSFIAVLLVSSLYGMAQFDNSNSFVRKAIVEYEMDGKGFYQKKEGALVDKVENVTNTYAYDKKAANLYVETKTGNYMVVLNKEYAKIYKQSKIAPIIDEDLIGAEVEKVSKKLEEHFKALNDARIKHLRDSAEKVRRDSIEKIRQDSIAKVMKENADKEYRATHDWHQLPIGKMGVECVVCGHHSYEDQVAIEGILKDTIYYIEDVKGLNNNTYKKIHASQISPKLAAYAAYQRHCSLFSDSISRHSYLSTEYMKAANEAAFNKYSESVATKTPYGYIDSWGYDIQETNLVVDLTFTNTNKKAIRAIDIYYNALDEAGNITKSGKLRTKSGIEAFETKSWSWDDPEQNQVPEGSTDLQITKVTLIYKDGKQRNLIKHLTYKGEEP